MQEKVRMASVLEVLDSVRKDGFTVDFMVPDGQVLAVMNGTETFTPDQVTLIDFYRFEGETNPDDMSILYVLQTKTGLKGTMSDAFGTYSDTLTENFMRQVEDIGKNLDKQI